MYKQKLIALLKALEVQDIEELIDKSTEHIIGVGLVISQAAKMGAKHLDASNQPLKSENHKGPECSFCGKDHFDFECPY